MPDRVVPILIVKGRLDVGGVGAGEKSGKIHCAVRNKAPWRIITGL